MSGNITEEFLDSLFIFRDLDDHIIASKCGNLSLRQCEEIIYLAKNYLVLTRKLEEAKKTLEFYEYFDSWNPSFQSNERSEIEDMGIELLGGRQVIGGKLTHRTPKEMELLND